MYVYVIRSSKDNRYYVGISSDVEQRLKDHNAGRAKSTKGYRPWVLIHKEIHPTRLAARKREVYLKSGYGKQWLKEKYRLVLPAHLAVWQAGSSVGYLPTWRYGRQGAPKSCNFGKCMFTLFAVPRTIDTM